MIHRGTSNHPFCLAVEAELPTIQAQPRSHWPALIDQVYERYVTSHGARFADVVRFSLRERLQLSAREPTARPSTTPRRVRPQPKPIVFPLEAASTRALDAAIAAGLGVQLARDVEAELFVMPQATADLVRRILSDCARWPNIRQMRRALQIDDARAESRLRRAGVPRLRDLLWAARLAIIAALAEAFPHASLEAIAALGGTDRKALDTHLYPTRWLRPSAWRRLARYDAELERVRTLLRAPGWRTLQLRGAPERTVA